MIGKTLLVSLDLIVMIFCCWMLLTVGVNVAQESEMRGALPIILAMVPFIIVYTGIHIFLMVTPRRVHLAEKESQVDLFEYTLGGIAEYLSQIEEVKRDE